MNEWEAKYRALLSGIQDQELVENAEKLVEAAQRVAIASPFIGFERSFYACLDAYHFLKGPPDLSAFDLPGLSIFFAWYDFWIGFYYDRKNRALYFCPLPMVVIKWKFK